MKHRTDSALAGRSNRRHLTPPPPAAPPPSDVPGRAEGTSAPRGLKDKITWVAIGDLKPFPGNPRHHPEDQIARLMRSIERVWTNPILIDETRTILAGHARLEAPVSASRWPANVEANLRSRSARPPKLLDDPVVGLATMSDGVDRQTLKLFAREFGRTRCPLLSCSARLPHQ
jgi:ParB-like nuclease family protein